MLPFHRAAEEDFLAVNALILDRLHTDVELVGNIGHYIIEGGGKRLRPLVVLLAALACGYRGRQHIPLAVVIEFIHTATLLHDDVVDSSEMRRGRLTANNHWGNSPAVLVGDFLYSRAFQMLVELGDMQIMGVLADTTNTIAEGEVEQLVNAGNPDVDEAAYLQVIRKKTAILFEAATRSGALLAEAESPVIEAMATYGHHLGMAFQIQDDVLDYRGDAEELGKNVGDDLAEGKPTLPLIHTLRHGTTEAAAVVRRAIVERNSDALADVVSAVEASGSLEYTCAMATQHVADARSALVHLPDSGYRQAMDELARFAIARSF